MVEAESSAARGFGVSADVGALAGAGRSVHDQIGRQSYATFRYPDGALCDLEGC
jgi:hypothetical protein